MKDMEPSPLSLGRSYLHIRNYDKALEFLGQAVMAGKGNAAKDLYDLGNHFYEEGDYAKAEKAFQMLADRGHGESCLRLGEMCEEGIGRRRDLEAAFGYYSESFNQGVAMGAYKAGMLMYPDALRQEEVRDIALTWFDEAIKADIAEAYAAVGDLYSSHFTMGHTLRDDHVAFTWYLKGTMHKDPRAMVRAADCFLNGYGTKKDPKRAVRLFEEAGQLGSPDAWIRLGQMYETGNGVYKEIRKALDYYMKAYQLDSDPNGTEGGDRMIETMIPFVNESIDKNLAELFENYLSVLRKAAYPRSYGLSAAMAQFLGDTELFEKYLKEGMEAGDEYCRHGHIDSLMRHIQQCFVVLESIMPDLPKKRKNKDFYKKYMDTLLTIKSQCLEAGGLGCVDAWQILAYVYLYHGLDLGASGEDFLNAAKNGMGGRIFDMDYFMWEYYDGFVTDADNQLKDENPKKAFTFARKLAEKRMPEFYDLLSDYYREGYGIRKNLKMAEKWANKK